MHTISKVTTNSFEYEIVAETGMQNPRGFISRSDESVNAANKQGSISVDQLRRQISSLLYDLGLGPNPSTGYGRLTFEILRKHPEMRVIKPGIKRGLIRIPPA